MQLQLIQAVFEFAGRKRLAPHIAGIASLRPADQRLAVYGLTFDLELVNGLALTLVMLDMLEQYKRLKALGVAHTWALERM